MFVPESIGTINYKIRKEIDPNIENNMIDSQAKEMIHTFSPPSGLSPEEYSQLFLQHYSKSRNFSENLIKGNIAVTIESLTVQVGNQECLDEIFNIQNSKNFIEWENQHFVDYFVFISKNLVGLG